MAPSLRCCAPFLLASAQTGAQSSNSSLTHSTQAYDGPFRFLSVGDWGAYSTLVDQQNAVARNMENLAANASPRPTFVVNAGDNFYHCGLVSDAQFNRVFLSRYGCDTHPSLCALPWYSVLGNHDYGTCGSPGAQIAWTSRDPTGRWKMPDYHFSVAVDSSDTSAAFFYIDSNVLIQHYKDNPDAVVNKCGGTPLDDGGETGIDGNCYVDNKKLAPGGKLTYQWLKDKFAACGAFRMKVVVMHHALPQIRKSTYGQKILDLLVQYKVDAVISGHWHYLAHYTYKGLHGYITGGGCAVGEQNKTQWCDDGCSIDKGPSVVNGFMMHEISGNAFKTWVYDSASGHPLWTEKHHRTSELLAMDNATWTV